MWMMLVNYGFNFKHLIYEIRPSFVPMEYFNSSGFLVSICVPALEIIYHLVETVHEDFVFTI